jgi:thiosulfate dehydrogenase (quinone) large subunit
VSQLEEPWEQLGLALGRMAIGIFWLTQLMWKLPPTFGCPASFAVSANLAHRPNGLCEWVGLMGKYSLLPAQRAFVEGVVAPHIQWIGWAIFAVEVFLAASLILGLLTRLGGLVGMIWAANLFIGLATAPTEWYWSYGMLFVLHWIFFFTTPGRVLGLDQSLMEGLEYDARSGSPMASLLRLWM